MSQKNPHEMNEAEQRELAERLKEIFSSRPCDFTEVEMTEDEHRKYEEQLAWEAQSDAEFMETMLQSYDQLAESEWPDGLFFSGISIRIVMQKRRAATAEQRKDA